MNDLDLLAPSVEAVRSDFLKQVLWKLICLLVEMEELALNLDLLQVFLRSLVLAVGKLAWNFLRGPLKDLFPVAMMVAVDCSPSVA